MALVTPTKYYLTTKRFKDYGQKAIAIFVISPTKYHYYFICLPHNKGCQQANRRKYKPVC